MIEARIYADFQKVDDSGFLILTTRGSIRDIEALGETTEGRQVVFYSDDFNDSGESDDLEVDGELELDAKRGIWIGIYDPEGFRHVSDRAGPRL